ncbi:MAG: GNAT family N-acetyltransferase [Fimbriimonadaceae bacterium]
MQLNFQIIETAAQWDMAAVLNTAFNPDDPHTGAELEAFAKEHPTDVFIRRSLAMDGDSPFAYIRIAQAYWLQDTSIAASGIAVDRTGDHVPGWVQCLEYVETMAAENGLTSVQIWFRADHPELIEQAVSRGYLPGQHNPTSAVDLTQFSVEPYQKILDAVRAEGYEIIDLNELIRRYPEDWIERYYTWENVVMRDIPMPGDFAEFPFETYKKMILSETLTREGYFMAIKDGVVAASSQINWNHVDRTLAQTGLTGTLRDARRMGLATALKAHAMNWAKSVGITRLTTDNEINNPMYQLNLALGFKWDYDVTEYSKKL